MNFRTVGKIKKTHGLDGTLFIIVKSLNSDFVCSLKYLFFGNQENKADDVLKIDTIRPYKQGYLVRFSEIPTIDAAEQIVQSTLFLPADDLPDEETTECPYLSFAVIDSQSDAALGIVENLLDYPGQQLLQIRRENDDLALVPFVDEFIDFIDMEGKTIGLRVMEGLFDEN